MRIGGRIEGRMREIEEMLLSFDLSLIQPIDPEPWSNTRKQATERFEMRVFGAVSWVGRFDRHCLFQPALREILKNRLSKSFQN